MKNKILFIAILFLSSCMTNYNDIDLFRIEKDGLYGFIDNNGKVVIKPQFDLALNFSENLAYARKDSVYGFIDKNGSFIIEHTLPKKYSFSKLLRTPVIEEKGIFGNYPKREDIRFSNGLCLFLDNTTNKYGYINKYGDYKIAPKFESAFPFSEGLAVIQIDGKFGFINTEGNIVIDCIYDHANSFCCNRAICKFQKTVIRKLDGREIPFYRMNVVVIDKTGAIINAPQGMAGLNDFSQNISVKFDINKLLQTGKGKTFLDKDLNLMTEYYFEDAKDFSENWAAIKVNGKWGFLKIDFQTIIEPTFDDVQNFHDSLAPVKADGKWGFINEAGDLIIENKYDTVSVFSNNLAYVVYDDNGFKIEGFIDKFGKIIWYKEAH